MKNDLEYYIHLFQEIKELVEFNSNDQILGAAIRKLIIEIDDKV